MKFLKIFGMSREARGNVLSTVEGGVLTFRVLARNDRQLQDVQRKLCESDKGVGCRVVKDVADYEHRVAEDGTRVLDDLCRSCRAERRVEKVFDGDLSAARDVERKIECYKRYAQQRNYSWELTDMQATLLFQQPCVFCGLEAAQAGRLGNCINRLDNTVRAYVLNNSVTACAVCNFIKLDHSFEDYVKICKTIASFRRLVPPEYAESYPNAFKDSPTVKTYRQYANATRRIMVMDEATFSVLLLQDCFYCGKSNNPPHHYNGIDRIDSRNRRYEIANVVPCCKTCNSLKWSMPVEKFLDHVKRVALFYDFEDPKKHPPKTWTGGQSREMPIEL